MTTQKTIPLPAKQAPRVPSWFPRRRLFRKAVPSRRALLSLSLLCGASCLLASPYTGINFSPYTDESGPGQGRRHDDASLDKKIALLTPHFDWIRTYGTSEGLDQVGRLAHAHGAKAALGAWLGRDREANRAEIERLIAAASRGEAEIVIVGSETLHRHDLSEEELITYLALVRSRIPARVLVTTADTADAWLQSSKLITAVDVMLVNCYPFWKEIPVEWAVPCLNEEYDSLRKIAAGRQVVISETGWPTGHGARGQAIASPENASRFVSDFLRWAKTRKVPYFLFSAFDENWKTAEEGPFADTWGIWDASLTLKACHRAQLLEPAMHLAPWHAPVAFTVLSVSIENNRISIRGLALGQDRSRMHLGLVLGSGPTPVTTTDIGTDGTFQLSAPLPPGAKPDIAGVQLLADALPGCVQSSQTIHLNLK